jgi:hypothetical protein
MIVFLLFGAVVALIDISGWSLEPLLIKLLYSEDSRVDNRPDSGAEVNTNTEKKQEEEEINLSLDESE